MKYTNVISKPISGRFFAVAEHWGREKPDGVGAVPFGEGVGMSPDIVDNIAEGGVAQESVHYYVGEVPSFRRLRSNNFAIFLK